MVSYHDRLSSCEAVLITMWESSAESGKNLISLFFVRSQLLCEQRS